MKTKKNSSCKAPKLVTLTPAQLKSVKGGAMMAYSAPPKPTR